MKIYILVYSWPYEGYDQPEGVYSTQELAEAQRDKLTKRSKRDRVNWEVLEYEVDGEAPKNPSYLGRP